MSDEGKNRRAHCAEERRTRASCDDAPRRELSPSGVSRRGFLKGMALTAGAAALPAEGVLGGSLAAQDEKGKGLGPGAVPVTLEVNGRRIELRIEPRVTLLDALRDHLEAGKTEAVDLTGTKRVCDRASCGACTMIVGGRTAYACSILAIDAQGKAIQTVEGIAGDGSSLDPVQEAFVHCDGLMCGFCTPGFVVSAKALLDENPSPTLEEVQRALDGNICRCGTQNRVIESVLLAAGKKGGR
jgi:xanthine dehydrogenase YagT iron-sulfur-binding subunit